MMHEPDPLAEAFAELRRIDVDPALLTRVGARARTELVPAARAASPSARLRMAVLASVVPALLLSAAAARFLEIVQIAVTIY